MTPEAEDRFHELGALVDPDRLAARTLELVSIESPSGQEADVAEAYGRMLRDIGLDVTVDRQYEESPSIIARLDSGRPGPTLQFAGHLDTVSSAHAPPAQRDGRIHARGACDMKGGMAAAVEAAEVLATVAPRQAGSLLVTAYGQHEEVVPPRPLHAPLVGLLERGIRGDACVIPEGPHRELPLAGRGLVIFRVWFRRDGKPVHEVLAGGGPAAPNPAMAAVEFAHRLEKRSRAWPLSHPLAGPESCFVGSVHVGDLYNRIPVEAEVWGTRRYPTGRTYAEVALELTELAEAVARERDVSVEVSLTKSGQPFAIARDEPIVALVDAAHRLVTGSSLPPAGLSYTADASHFINVGGIPTVYHGTNSDSAHADEESVAIDELVRCAKVLLATGLGYLDAAGHR